MDSPEATAVRQVPQAFKRNQTDPSDPSDLTDLSDQRRWALYAVWLEAPDAAIRANALICLIHQTNFLLDRQIAALERAFVEEGGYSEQLATARLAERRKNHQPDTADRPDPRKIPACPPCGGQMALRTAKAGQNTGQQFRGCTDYPKCRAP